MPISPEYVGITITVPETPSFTVVCPSTPEAIAAVMGFWQMIPHVQIRLSAISYSCCLRGHLDDHGFDLDELGIQNVSLNEACVEAERGREEDEAKEPLDEPALL
jgi:hypothetical protein